MLVGFVEGSGSRKTTSLRPAWATNFKGRQKWHTSLIPGLGWQKQRQRERQRQIEHFEFKASLVNRVSSRADSTMQRNLKTKQNKTKSRKIK